MNLGFLCVASMDFKNKIQSPIHNPKKFGLATVKKWIFGVTPPQKLIHGEDHSPH